jgi:hypothetical protein
LEQARADTEKYRTPPADPVWKLKNLTPIPETIEKKEELSADQIIKDMLSFVNEKKDQQ